MAVKARKRLFMTAVAIVSHLKKKIFDFSLLSHQARSKGFVCVCVCVCVLFRVVELSSGLVPVNIV